MLRLLVVLGVVLAAGAGLPSLARQVLSSPLSVEQLTGGSFLVVDIRTPEEWRETGVLPDALLLTYTRPDQFLAALRPHLEPGRPVALICRTGNRTARAAREIGAQLDVPVIDVAGGMFRLMRAGYRPEAPRRDQGCAIC